MPLSWSNVPFQKITDCRVVFDQTAYSFLTDARVLVDPSRKT
jgi:hypothetical protein